MKEFNFEKPAALHSKFLPSLQGDIKMSSSKEGGQINLSDTEKEVEIKIKRYAFSGGRDTIEEHRKKGGVPEKDVSFQYLKFFFEPDDDKLMEVYREYKSGRMLTSELKEILIEKINKFLKEHQKAREKARSHIDKFLVQ